MKVDAFPPHTHRRSGPRLSSVVLIILAILVSLLVALLTLSLPIGHPNRAQGATLPRAAAPAPAKIGAATLTTIEVPRSQSCWASVTKKWTGTGSYTAATRMCGPFKFQNARVTSPVVAPAIGGPGGSYTQEHDNFTMCSAVVSGHCSFSPWEVGINTLWYWSLSNPVSAVKADQTCPQYHAYGWAIHVDRCDLVSGQPAGEIIIDFTWTMSLVYNSSPASWQFYMRAYIFTDAHEIMCSGNGLQGPYPGYSQNWCQRTRSAYGVELL